MVLLLTVTDKEAAYSTVVLMTTVSPLRKRGIGSFGGNPKLPSAHPQKVTVQTGNHRRELFKIVIRIQIDATNRWQLEKKDSLFFKGV